MVSPFLAFLIGCCFGMFTMMVIAIHWVDRKRRPAVKPPMETFPAKAGVFLRELVNLQSKPIEPKRPGIAAVPRSAGSWRRQKAAIEREHNSQQKERDRGIAGL
jgi:hypothetical protein